MDKYIDQYVKPVDEIISATRLFITQNEVIAANKVALQQVARNTGEAVHVLPIGEFNGRGCM